MEPVIPIIAKVESPISDAAIREMPTPMPLPVGPDVFVANFTMVPSTEMIPTINPEPDLLAATWDQVKDGPKDDGVDKAIDVLSGIEDFIGPAGF